MRLAFPATTDELIRQNPLAWPDSIREILRFHALLGGIREIRGRWYVIRKDQDELLQRARSDNLPKKPKPPRPACLVCGKPCGRPHSKLCSRECHGKYQSKPKPQCRRKGCDNEVKKHGKMYCSVECARGDRRPTGPRKKLWHWRQRRVLQ